MSESSVRTTETDESGSNTRVLVDDTESGRTRRQFLGSFGGSIAAVGILPEIAEAQEIPTISMGNYYFDPVGLAVEPGTTVRFEIDTGTHSATAYEDRIPSDAAPFDSGTISQGGFEYTFDTRGTYDFYCVPHKAMGMTGRIVVGEPGGPAEATPIPDGDVPASDEIVTKGSVNIDTSDISGKHAPGGMMEFPSGMMASGSPSWRMLVPAGVVTTTLALVGGAMYWLFGQQPSPSSRDDTAISILKERYAQGRIDEDEYEHRKAKLNSEE